MTLDRILGPVLIVDHVADARMHLAAVFVAPSGMDIPPIRLAGSDVPATFLISYGATEVWRARFDLPADAPSSYDWNGATYPVASNLSGDLRLAFASCNGEEHGDLDRAFGERNAMWARMAEDHRKAPFALLLHGGDQVYADEATKGHPLSEDWPAKIPRDPLPHDLDDLRAHLCAGFAERYIAQLRDPDYAWLAARVPSLSQWDDHDICDGWGSLPRSRTYSPVGQLVFEVAKEAALAFQHGTVAGDLPARFADPDAYHLNWSIRAPGLRLMAPDLRSERTRRQVMDDGGWADVARHAEAEFTGRTLVISSVPLLGPRLSILEALMVLTPRMQKYEDDLRDQWQSRAHREGWRRMLRAMLRMHETDGQDVTVLSGEIHLATRAEMDAEGAPLQQLVASGITHRPPPRAWARALHLLSTLGEAPLPAHPIRIRRIPGQRGRYVAERNYLTLTRTGTRTETRTGTRTGAHTGEKAGPHTASDTGGAWSARWEFEHSGTSPAHPL